MERPTSNESQQNVGLLNQLRQQANSINFQGALVKNKGARESADQKLHLILNTSEYKNTFSRLSKTSEIKNPH